MCDILLISSMIILMIAGLRLLFRNKVSSCLIYSLWLPVAAYLLVLPLVHLLTRGSAALVDYTVAGVPVGGIMALVWLAGTTALTTWFVTTGWFLCRDMHKDAEPFLCPESPVPVWVNPNINTPCLFGLFRPAIYLTPDIAADTESCRHVLAHEMTHLRHGDHIWSFIRRICLCFYWFHPLVWLAVHMSKQDSELACDEGALKRLGEAQRMAYGRTLVDMAVASSEKSCLETDVYEARKEAPPQTWKDKRKRKPLMVWVVGLFAGAVLIAGAATWLLQGDSGEQAVILESVAVEQEPYRCHYVHGEALDTRGMKLQLTYSDGTTRTVTEGFSCSPEKMEIIGKQTVTVTYGDMVAKFVVDIGEVSDKGTCGESLQWTLTKQGSLIITGTGAMSDYQQGRAPWSKASAIRAVSLTEGVTSIGTYAFAESGVKSLRIPDSVVTIGEGAFSFCEQLERCSISASVTRLNTKTFCWCLSLEQVILPAGLTAIDEGAFESCLALKEISLPAQLKSIGKGAFRFCQSLKYITIPGSVTKIGGSAFSGCTQLEQVNLSEGITEIGTGTFFGCDLMEEVFIPASVTKLDEDTFQRLEKLRAIWVAPGNPKYETDECGVLYTKGFQKMLVYPLARGGSYEVAPGCQIIDEYAFSSCILEKLTLPETLCRIEAYAFFECKGLVELTLPKSVCYVEASAILHGGAGRITFLNPQCQIDSKNYLATRNSIICGYKDSTAWQYAQKYGFKFEEIS